MHRQKPMLDAASALLELGQKQEDAAPKKKHERILDSYYVLGEEGYHFDISCDHPLTKKGSQPLELLSLKLYVEANPTIDSKHTNQVFIQERSLVCCLEGCHHFEKYKNTAGHSTRILREGLSQEDKDYSKKWVVEQKTGNHAKSLWVSLDMVKTVYLQNAEKTGYAQNLFCNFDNVKSIVSFIQEKSEELFSPEELKNIRLFRPEELKKVKSDEDKVESVVIPERLRKRKPTLAAERKPKKQPQKKRKSKKKLQAVVSPLVSVAQFPGVSEMPSVGPASPALSFPAPAPYYPPYYADYSYPGYDMYWPPYGMMPNYYEYDMQQHMPMELQAPIGSSMPAGAALASGADAFPSAALSSSSSSSSCSSSGDIIRNLLSSQPAPTPMDFESPAAQPAAAIPVNDDQSDVEPLLPASKRRRLDSNNRLFAPIHSEGGEPDTALSHDKSARSKR